MPAGFLLHHDYLTIPNITQILELLYAPMEPTHEKQPKGHPMCNNKNIPGKVRLTEIPMQGLKKCAHPIINIGARFTVGDPVIKKGCNYACS